MFEYRTRKFDEMSNSETERSQRPLIDMIDRMIDLQINDYLLMTVLYIWSGFRTDFEFIIVWVIAGSQVARFEIFFMSVTIMHTLSLVDIIDQTLDNRRCRFGCVSDTSIQYWYLSGQDVKTHWLMCAKILAQFYFVMLQHFSADASHSMNRKKIHHQYASKHTCKQTTHV